MLKLAKSFQLQNLSKLKNNLICFVRFISHERNTVTLDALPDWLCSAWENTRKAANLRKIVFEKHYQKK